MLLWSRIRIHHYALIILLAVAGVLRLYHFNFGLGTHPDERHMIMVVEKLSWNDPNPHSFAYGSLPYYLLWLSSETLGLWWPELRQYDGLFSVGRILCTVCGLITIFITYLLSVRLFKKPIIGLLAAALLGFNFFHIQLSRYFTSDIPLTLFCMLTLYGSVVFLQSQRFWPILLMAIPLGMALATKISSVFLIAPIAIACIAKAMRENWSATKIISLILCGAIVGLGVAFICAPYYVLDYETFHRHITEQTDMVRGRWVPPYTIQYQGTIPYLYHLKEMFLYTMGWPVMLACLFGIGVAGYQAILGRSVGVLILLAWIIVFFLATGGFQVKFPRYLLPIYPPLFILASFSLLGSAWDRTSRSRNAPLSRIIQDRTLSFELPSVFPRLIEARGARIIIIAILSLCFLGLLVCGSLPGYWPSTLLMMAVAGIAACFAGAIADRSAAVRPIFDPAASSREIFGLALLGVLGFALRIFQLETIPFTLHNDEMNIGLSAQRLLDSNSPALFSTGWLSQPQLSYAFSALALGFGQHSLFWLRISSLFFGMVSIFALYFLVRAIWGIRTAFWTALLLTVAHWHLQFSRSGFVYMQGAAIALLTLCTLVYAYRSNRLSIVAAGAFFLSLSVQTSYQSVLLLSVVAIWCLLLTARKQTRESYRLTLPLALLGILAYFLIPLFEGMSQLPGPLPWSEQNDFVFADQHANHVRSIYGSLDWSSVLMAQFFRTIGLFYGGGDSSMQYGLPAAALDPLCFVAFILGVIACCLRSWRDMFSLLLVSIFVTLFIFFGVLSLDPPSLPRLLLFCCFIPAFIAFGLDRFIELIHKYVPWRGTSIISSALVILTLGYAVAWNLYSYFERYADTPHASQDIVVRLMGSHPSAQEVINATDTPINFNYESFRFLVPQMSGENVSSPSMTSIEYAINPEVASLIVLPIDSPLREELRNSHPGSDEGSVDSLSWVAIQPVQ